MTKSIRRKQILGFPWICFSFGLLFRQSNNYLFFIYKINSIPNSIIFLLQLLKTKDARFSGKGNAGSSPAVLITRGKDTRDKGVRLDTTYS